MVALRLVVLLIKLVVLACLVQSRTVDVVRQDVSLTDWDSLLFSLHWPVTACLIWREGKPGNTCVPPENHVWTIHGIWPNQERGQGPFFCNRTWAFDPQSVEAIKPQLLKFWPNIHGNDTEYSLWKHEWDKHGTCAATDPKFGTEQLYFHQGVQWIKTYHITKLLSKNGITPSFSGRYNSTKIQEVLRTELGVEPIVGCEVDKETGSIYLSEVRLCFKRDLNLVDCMNHHHTNTRSLSSVIDCPAQKPIIYPGKYYFIKNQKQYKNKVHVDTWRQNQ